MTVTNRVETAPDGRPILWQPVPGFQVRALQCDADDALLGGAAGPGKTDCLIAYHGARAAKYENARELFLRTRFKDLTDVMDRMWALYPGLGATWREQEKRWTFPLGGTLEVGYGANLREISQYLGRQFTGVGFDEIGELAEIRPWEELSSRVRSTDPRIPLRRRGTANPGGPGHGWLKRRYVVPCGKKGERVVRDSEGFTIAYVPGTLKDNPYLPESYRKRLRAMSPLRRRQLEDGDWDAAGGMFFEGLNPDALYIRRLDRSDLDDRWRFLPEWWTYWGSYDWGFRHWMWGGAWAKDGDGSVILLDSLWLRRKQDSEQAESMRDFLPAKCRRCVYAGGDAFAKHQAHAAQAETVADVFLRSGVVLERAVLDRVAGAQAMTRMLTATEGETPIVRVCDTPGNRRTVEQWGEMVVDPDDTRDVLKVDADEDGNGGDDGYDGARYGIVSPGFTGKRPDRSMSEYALIATSRDDGLERMLKEHERGGRPVERRPQGPEGQADLENW